MSIKEIIKNKKYSIEVVTGYDGNRKLRTYETFEGGKKEAILRENQIKLEVKNNTFIKNTKKTMKELIEEWLKLQKNVWSPKTYVANRHWCDVIIKSIGHIKLKNINVKLLEEFYDKLKSETKYSPKTIQHFYTLISACLNKAVDWEYIAKNPNNKIPKPKVKQKERLCYNRDEVEQLLNALKSESLKYQALIVLALDSGARRGELTGLTWEDIDFENSTININKTTQYVKEYGIYEKSPKSETSNRVITIAEKTLNLLKKYKREQLEKQLKLGNKWQGSKRVFTTDFGADMHPDTPSQIFERIIKKHNLKRIPFHSLRHTSISLLSSLGVPIQEISERAGHSSIEITNRIYNHVYEDDKRKTAVKINTILEMKAI